MNKKSFGVLIGVLVLILVGVGGYFILDKKEKTENPTLEASRWNTYTNTKYGFEFQYPDNLEITEESDIAWFWLSLYDRRDRQIFGFSVSINHPGLGFEGTETISSTNVMVNGIRIHKEILQTVEGEYGEPKSSLYNFEKGKDEYLILASDSEKMDEIISTFKFTK